MMTFKKITGAAILMAGLMMVSCSEGEDLTTMGINDNSSTNNGTDTSAVDAVVIEDNADDFIENTTFDDTIEVVFTNGSANVKGEADGVTVTLDGGDIIVNSTTNNFIMYELSGTTNNGMFKLYSDRKWGITLKDVDITNDDGPAINVQSGKRGFVVLADGTTNRLADGSTYASSSEDQKGTLFAEGQICFSGAGSLTIDAHAKSAINSDDYLFFRHSGTISVTASNGNAVRGKDRVTVRAGSLNITALGNGKKGIKSDGRVVFNGGTTIITTTGAAVYDADEGDIAGVSGVKCDSTFTMNEGELTIKCSGKGAKGISTDMGAVFNGGTLLVTTTGTTYTYSRSLDSKAKGVKADGNININGGSLTVNATGGEGSEGIEAKNTILVTGGTVYVTSYDDALNSAGDMTISGGTVFGYGMNNDGLDSNGNMFLRGGVVMGFGGKTPEEGLDVAENKYLSITGGHVIGLGAALMTKPSASVTKQYCWVTTASMSKNADISVTTGSETYSFPFKTPLSLNTAYVVLSTPAMSANSAVSLSIGSSSTTGNLGSTMVTNNAGGGFPGGRAF